MQAAHDGISRVRFGKSRMKPYMRMAFREVPTLPFAGDDD